MLVILCIHQLLLLTIHSFADEQICFFRIADNRGCRPCIGRIGQLQSLSGRSQHHIRRQNSAILRCNRHPLLKRVPVFQRDFLSLCAFLVKPALSVQLHCISITGHSVIDLECLEAITIQREFLLIPLYFHILNFKWQFRCYDSQCIHNPGQPFRSDQCQRLRPLCVSHRQKETGKSADVIPMEMSEADDINRLEAPSLLAQRNLGSFPAVNQKTASVISHHQTCQMAVRQRHHSAAAEQTDIKHGSVFLPLPHNQCILPGLFVIVFPNSLCPKSQTFIK